MTKIQLDTLDKAIVSHLVKDGRKSFADMASDLGVSAGTVRNRLARLEESGTVRVIGYVDLEQVGINVYATIHLRVTPSRLINDVVKQLSSFPEVSFLVSVAGEFDLHADVQCINNDHLMTLLRERIHTIEGVVDTKTTMILQIHKYGQPDLEILRLLAND